MATKVPNEAINGVLQENVLFLLMLLRRVLLSSKQGRLWVF